MEICPHSAICPQKDEMSANYANISVKRNIPLTLRLTVTCDGSTIKQRNFSNTIAFAPAIDSLSRSPTLHPGVEEEFTQLHYYVTNE